MQADLLADEGAAGASRTVMTGRVRAYSYALGLTFWALIIAVLAFRHSQLPSLAEVAPFLALAIAGEELVVLQRQRSGGSVLSFSAAAHVAAAIVIGPTAAAFVAASAVVIVDGLRREAFPHVVINSAMFGSAIWIAGAIFTSIVENGDRLDPAAFPALVALISVRYLVTSTIFAGGTALATGSRFGYVLRAAVVEEIGSAVGEGSLGVLVAVALSRHDWIVLPFLLPLLAALYRSKATLARLQVETDAALQSVASVVDERDPTTAAHSERVAELVRDFTDAIHLPRREADRLIASARFHDLGKIAVDVATLSKEGRLTEAELRSIRSHPRLSARLLAPFHFAREIAGFVELHHERYDGRGYYAVPGPDVPIEAHVLIVADSFDAMTSVRPYRPALSIEEAALELEDKAGTQFHPSVAPAFAAIVRGRSVDEALGEEAVAKLRQAFSTVPTIELPPSAALLQPRPWAVLFAVAALAFIGIPGVPMLGVVCCAVAAAACAVGSTVFDIRLRRRVTRARDALEGGAPPSIALAAAGIGAWSAWLRPSDETTAYAPFVADLGAPREALAEICKLAVRHDRYGEAPLASGGVLLLSRPSRGLVRLAVVLSTQPSPVQRQVVREVFERALLSPPTPDSGPRDASAAERRRRRAHDGLHVMLDVELEIFEDVRRAAGQLIAERVLVDIEERLRALLRATDALVRLGDDRFAISLVVADEEAATRFSERIRGQLERVLVPCRVEAIEPRISIAVGEQMRNDPRFFGLLKEVERAGRPARAVG
jgi:HD-GYP domain-containing protein (c-di-GMP phosphodiesterase class II)/GGDEF domain-containing protein